MTMAAGGILLLAAMLAAGDSGAGNPFGEFALGPVVPTVNLRNMVREHIVAESCAALAATARRRVEAVEAGNWREWRDAVRRQVRDDLGEIRFGPGAPELNVRVVSRHERPGYVVENVLFESLPGWDVNASVYLPVESDWPAPWPAVVIPVGHSSKTRESYQAPAQVFARFGYVAVTFDPPGMAGEKQAGNDHFRDGVRCHLTGHSSNRYFVADALRCIDYLETRPDVDMRRGVGMTGVSGGGFTTMFATLLDDRIAASGPSCCTGPNALHPVMNAYAPCVETLAAGRFAVYDDIDVLAAAAPTPTLLMAGELDEVFRIEWGHEIAREARQVFAAAGDEDRFAFFVDPGGHAYTVAMALEFTKWLDRHLRDGVARDLPALTRDDFEMVAPELLMCGPRQEENMFTLNRSLALHLREHRSGMRPADAARSLCRLEEPVATPEFRAREPFLTWFHHVQELILVPGAGIELPATFLCPAAMDGKVGAVLYFDDRGRWTDMRRHGLLAQLSEFFNEKTKGPAVLTVDLRGWGDSAPAETPYDIAGWAAPERWVSYVSAALGDPIFAMRVRDGLAALAWLRAHPAVDPQRLVVGGRGMGGLVALHVGAVDGRVAGVFSLDAPATFESLATSPDYAWPLDAFLPHVLRHYDIPELAAACAAPVLIANPLDALKETMSPEVAAAAYRSAAEGNQGFRLAPGAEADAALRAFVAERAR